MINDWQSLVEAGRSLISASRLGGIDEKFPLGDLMVEAGPLDDGQLRQLAEELGSGLKVDRLRSYREVAEAWPPETRVDASWTTHRTLAKQPNRLEVIKPGMTLRGAQAAAGRRTSDDAHPDRWSLDRRVTFVVSQLQDKELNQTLQAEVEGQKHARQVRKAARDVQDETSAAYREARRELRDRYNAQGPEAAILKAIFRLREAAESVRAVGRAAIDEDSWLPEHRKPDVVAAVRDLAIISVEALAAIGVRDRALTAAAFAGLSQRLRSFDRPNLASGSSESGLVIDMTPFADDDGDFNTV